VPSTEEARVASAAKARGVWVRTAIIRISLAINVGTGRGLAAVVSFSRARLAFIDVFAIETSHGIFASTHLEVAIMSACRTFVDVGA
jgi:hypothetical protein